MSFICNTGVTHCVVQSTIKFKVSAHKDTVHKISQQNSTQSNNFLNIQMHMGNSI